jgi:hypothetical protein
VAKQKNKAGKKAKHKKVNKASTPRSRAPRRAPSPAAASAPAAAKVDVYAQACAAGKPIVALVGKADGSVPVQLKNEKHLAELRQLHGDVRVQS